MNFSPTTSPFNMPELRWYWGYPFALALMLATAGSLLLFFRRKGWIGAPRQEALGHGAGVSARTDADPDQEKI